MNFSIFGASDTTTSPAKPEEQVPKVEDKADEVVEEARGGEEEEPTAEQKDEEDQREKEEEEPPREEDVVEDKKEEDDADPRTSTLTGSATASLTADGKSTYLAFLEESHKNGGPSTAGRGRKKSAATGSRRSASSRSSRSRSRSTRRSRSRSTRQEKRSMSKNNKAKKETAPPPAKEAEATKEERRSRSLSPRKLVGSFRKSKTDQDHPPPSSYSSSTKEVAMADMTTADGKSAYLAYLEANHKASAGGSKKKRASSRSRSRSRSRPQKSTTTEKPNRRSLSRPRKSSTTEKTDKPKRRSLSPRRKSNRIYAKPSTKATKKDLLPADKQSSAVTTASAAAASAPGASVAPAVVDGKSEYLAFLEANNKMGSSGKKPSGGGSRRNLFRSKSKRSTRSVPVDTDTAEEATAKKGAEAPVYVETKDINLDDGTKDKGIACDESQPPTDDSFVEPEELKDVAIANMDTPVLSNIAEAATDDETTSAPSTAEVEQETELTKSGFFDNLLDCTSMGFCLASSKSPTTVISEDLMPAEDK